MALTHSWLPWGKNFRTLPAVLEAALTQAGDQDLVVACTKTVTLAEIAAGDYRHLEVTTADDLPETWRSLLPSPNVGRTSHRNATVLDEPVKTLGKQPKRIEGRAPDWRGGTFHTTHYWRDVWPRRLLIPAMSRLAFRRMGAPAPDGSLTVRFQIEEVLTPSAPDFLNEVLRCVNLLQENVGTVDVSPLDAPEAAQLRRTAEQIGWEPLPELDSDGVIAAALRRLGRPATHPRFEEKARERLAAIQRLRPRQLLQGSGTFTGYFAAVFADDLVAFENLEIDHALYVLHGEWRELGQLTRTELRVQFADSGLVDRILHTPGWEERLTRAVKRARGEPVDAQAELFPE